MIPLTRLRHTDHFYVNPDHIERIEHHHDTNVHLFNGTEFVVSERPEEIVELVIAQRARIMAAAARLSAELDVRLEHTTHQGPTLVRDDHAPAASNNASSNNGGPAWRR